MLDELLHEVASKPPQWEPILDDIAKIISHIIATLGLGIPVISKAQQKERWQDICHSLSAVLSVLHIALMTFIRSHIDISGAVPNGALNNGLQIEAPGGKVFLAARRLQCLHGLIKQPVWAFNFIPQDSRLTKVDCDGFYVSSSMDDLAELWGPFRVNYADNSQAETVNSIETRGGTILALDSSHCHVKPLDDEALCHWFSWLDVSGRQQSLNEVGSIDTAKRLLVGMVYDSDCHSQKRQKRRRRPKLEVVDECMCNDRYTIKYDPFDLGTREPSWKLDARTLQASGGKYFTVSVGFTYKFDAGWTLKDAILESWLGAAKDDLFHLQNPHYMDYFVVLDISRCSGHARRISLWTLLKCSDLREYFRQNLEAEICRGLETSLLQYSSESCFTTIWRILDTSKRNHLTLAFKFMLKTLRCTGVGEDGMLQVWDITSIPRIDGRRIDPQWTSLVRDDIGCATFAIITGNCRIYKPPVQAHCYTPLTSLPILYTQVCITANQKLKPRDVSQKELEIPPHSNESNSRSFSSKWRVPGSQSADIRHSRSLILNPPNAESKLLESIRERQRARKKLSGGDRVHDSTSQPVSSESIQSEEPRIGRQPNAYDDRLSVFLNKAHRSRVQEQGLPEPGICDVNLSFKNGKGQRVGKLLLEPLEGPTEFIDLNSLSETSALPARWEASKSSVLHTIYEKGEKMDKDLNSWVRKSSGFIPSLIGRIAPEEHLSSPDVTEYIRPGNLTEYQRLLTTYIR